MRRFIAGLILSIAVAGCSSHGASNGPPTSTSVANIPPTSGHISTPLAATPGATKSPAPNPTAAPVKASTQYSDFLTSVCHAFASHDTGALTSFLPYYQYNSGLRYGVLGDGEGQTGDPTLLGTWLQTSQVSCRSYTPDRAGHGTLLTSGWKQPGGFSLIDLDTYNGNWKFNDFTFGSAAALTRAMKTSQPILAYHGH